MRTLVIAGAGGFGAEVAWVAEDMNGAIDKGSQWIIRGYVDDNVAKAGNVLYGHKVLGTPEEIAEDLQGKEVWYHCAIGINAHRRTMAARLNAFGWHAATLIHPSAILAKDAKIGQGVYVGALSILSTNSTVGDHVIVNQRAVVGHDTVIHDYVMLCPGAQINGNCTVEQGALVGSNASIMQGCAVGENAVVGANSLVIRSVAPGTSVLGIPASNLGKFI